jgi:hypothetical protein
MREHLRRTCNEGWIINLSPEGHRPDVSTRIFPGVRQTLAIGLFTRTTAARKDIRATIYYREVNARRSDKYEQLKKITLDGDGWRDARTAWQSTLTPAATWSAGTTGRRWTTSLPWTAPGIRPNKTWVYSPHPSVLGRDGEHLACVGCGHAAVDV